jgi:hypothetical protein
VGIVKPEDQNSPSYIAFKSAYITVRSELLQKKTSKEAPVFPMSDSLVNNTGTIRSNKMDHNVIINGRPEPLIITSNSGTINSNAITNNFIDGNVSLLDNSGTIVENEVSGNTVMGRQRSDTVPPYKIIDDGRPMPAGDGTFVCSFQIQIKSAWMKKLPQTFGRPCRAKSMK